jgi:ketosteroid isomerase-like protein
MNTPTAELSLFLQNYEEANNSHVWSNVGPMIAPDATYWFTDGSFTGLEEIRSAVEATFAKIQDEKYEIKDIRWPVVTEEMALCTYRFTWEGTIDGEKQSGSGRGTNILERRDGHWQIVHEHLSS